MFLVLTPLASCLRTSRDDKIGMLVVVVVVVVVKIVVGISVVVGIVVKTVVVVVVLVRGQIYFSTIVSRKYKSTFENLKKSNNFYETPSRCCSCCRFIDISKLYITANFNCV